MLRSICFGMSAFLLLSTVNIQKAESNSRVVVAEALKAVRATAATVRTVRGAQAITNFTLRSRAFPQLRALLVSNNVVVPAGANLRTVLRLLASASRPGNEDFMGDVAMDLFAFNLEFRTAFQRDIAAAESTAVGRSDGTGLNEDAYAFETFEQPAGVVTQDQLAIYPSSVADQMATEKSNYKNVITAFRDALLTRASNFGLPQLSGLAERVYTHLNTLVDRSHIMLLGARAEECTLRWGESYNSAVQNKVSILLGVPNHVRTYASAADYMLKAMYNLFKEGVALLQGRLNIIVNRCGIYSSQLPVSA